MSKIQILIIEDESIIAENLRFCLDDLGYEIVGTCYTFAEAQAAINNKTFDLVFLDINLGDANESNNGLALAMQLNETNKAPFIFITAYNDIETIKSAAKLHPYGYIIKPVNNAVLFANVQIAIERFQKQNDHNPKEQESEKPDFFFVKVGNRNSKILWNDILCIEAGKNYVKLKARSTNVDYPIRGSLSYVIDNLLPQKLLSNFVKVNRSQYLNKQYITGYDNNFVYCGNDKFENVKSGIRHLKKSLDI